MTNEDIKTRSFEAQVDNGELHLVTETISAPRYALKDGREVVAAGDRLLRIVETGELLTPKA